MNFPQDRINSEIATIRYSSYRGFTDIIEYNRI